MEFFLSLHPTHIVDYINSVPICLNGIILDGLTWKGTLDGIYTTRGGYSWLEYQHEPNVVDTMSGWNWIWKAPMPEKLICFIWTTCHNSLPTLVMLTKRNMGSFCHLRCSTTDEYFVRCIQDCSLTPQVWSYLGFKDHTFLHESNPLFGFIWASMEFSITSLLRVCGNFGKLEIASVLTEPPPLSTRFYSQLGTLKQWSIVPE